MIIAKYKFNSTIDTLPTFNSGYNYSYSDIDNEDGTITRTITGDTSPTTLNFRNCDGLLEVYELNISGLNSMLNMFSGCSSLRLIHGMGEWNTDKITTMSTMFWGCSALESVDGIENWNTKNVTSFSYMFTSCYSLTKIDVSNFDTSNAESFTSMFSGCSALKEVDVSGFNTDNTTRIDWMFSNCTSLKSVDLSNFNLSIIESMHKIFYQCSSLISVDISGWNINSNVVNYNDIFQSCDKLTSIYMLNTSYSNINLIIQFLPLRVDMVQSSIFVSDKTNIDISYASSINWGVVIQFPMRAKYKFNSAIDTLPTFNSGYEYSYVDFDNEDGTVTRTIMGENSPTSISFNSSMGLLEVYSLDISALTSFGSMFNGCENLIIIQGTENWDTSNIKSMSGTFQSCKKLISLNCTNWDVSNVTSMTNIFYACDAITDLGDLSNWNVGKVTDFGFAFRRTGKLKSIGNISNWNVSKSSGFRYMFFQSGITSIDMSNWVFDEEKTSTINFSGMFGDCKSLVEIRGIERLPMHRGNTLQQTFYNCKALTELNIGNWDVSNITNMQQAFSGCTSLTTLDLSNWNTSKVTTINSCFSGCTSLTKLNLSGWHIKALTNTNYAFSSCSKLQEINLSGWDSSSITNMENVFTNDTNLNAVILNECSIDTINFFINILPTKQEGSKGSISTILEKEDFSSVDTTMASSKFWDIVNRFTVAKYIFNSTIETVPVFNFTNYQYVDKLNEDNTTTRVIYHTSSPTKINFSSKTGLLEVLFLDMSNISDVAQMFYRCTALTKVNTDDWNTSKVTNTSNMFGYCSVLTELDLSNLNLSNVDNMQSMFNKCYALTTIGDTSEWNVGKVTNMNYMFEGCSSLRELNTSNWDMSSVKTMTQTFDGCSLLTKLDVSNWRFSAITSLSMTFSNCTSLTTLDVSNWDVSNVTTMLNMFSGCSSLTDMNLSRWDISSLTNTGNMFNKCSSLKSLDMSNLDMSKVTTSNNMFNATDLRKIKLLDNPSSTIERIITLLPAKKTENTGYLFVREEYSNSKKWENIICKETVQSILIPRQLNKVDEVSDRLYWDDDKNYYCIEQNIDDDYTILSEPTIIDLPNLNQKYFLDTYLQTTSLSCSNSPIQPSRIFVETDKLKYKHIALEPNEDYLIQFNCKEKSSTNIKFDLDGSQSEIEANIGTNQLIINSPEKLSTYRLNVSGEGNKISDVMLIKGISRQSLEYFDGIQSVGELQEDGTYKINITTTNSSGELSYSIPIILNEPLRKIGDFADRIYWDHSLEKYCIERKVGVITYVGDETWTSQTLNVEYNRVASGFYTTIENAQRTTSSYMVINDGGYICYSDTVYSYKPKAIGINGSGRLFLSLYNDEFNYDGVGDSSTIISLFKQYLSNNPVTIYYIYNTPIVEEVAIDGETVNLPRLYQKEQTYFEVISGNISPSNTSLEFNDFIQVS